MSDTRALTIGARAGLSHRLNRQVQREPRRGAVATAPIVSIEVAAALTCGRVGDGQLRAATRPGRAATPREAGGRSIGGVLERLSSPQLASCTRIGGSKKARSARVLSR